MFTGLVEDTARLVRVTPAGGVDRYRFEPLGLDASALVLGESVAIDGVCLTVVAFDSRGFQVEATPETLSRATLGSRRPGERVNVERALRLGGRLGGHLVTGHVDATGTVEELRRAGAAVVGRFRFPPELGPFLVEKGSVAIDGVSLTVNEVGPEVFSVYLIPHTLDVTTLGDRRPGDRVNLETDLIGKYVVRALAARGEAPAGITEAFLAEHGFLGAG